MVSTTYTQSTHTQPGAVDFTPRPTPSPTLRPLLSFVVPVTILFTVKAAVFRLYSFFFFLLSFFFISRAGVFIGSLGGCEALINLYSRESNFIRRGDFGVNTFEDGVLFVWFSR